MKKLIMLIVAAICLSQPSSSQIRVVATEKLALDPSKEWTLPQFSPDGKRIYLTRSSYSGIWEYDCTAKSVRCLTTDRGSGNGFAVSADGRQLAYRRTLNSEGVERQQEMILLDLLTGQSSVVSRGADLSAPSFIHASVGFIKNGIYSGAGAQASGDDVTLLGIERTKIVLREGAATKMLDPLDHGSYIWPVLSPDRRRLVAYEMDRGTFVCSLDGAVVTMLGRRDAPSWTRSGRWIVYMKDVDDGERILGSDLYAVAPDGSGETKLTATEDSAEMFPSCSAVENKIVCSALDGRIFVLTYEETAQ